jgi:hypothetical protein
MPKYAQLHDDGTIDAIYIFEPQVLTRQVVAADGSISVEQITAEWVPPIADAVYEIVPDDACADWRKINGVWTPPDPDFLPSPPAETTAEQIRTALKATGKTDVQIDALFALASAI